jgi:hypothetical protein
MNKPIDDDKGAVYTTQPLGITCRIFSVHGDIKYSSRKDVPDHSNSIRTVLPKPTVQFQMWSFGVDACFIAFVGGWSLMLVMLEDRMTLA